MRGEKEEENKEDEEEGRNVYFKKKEIHCHWCSAVNIVPKYYHIK